MNNRAVSIFKRDVRQRFGDNISKEVLFSCLRSDFPDIVAASNRVISMDFHWEDLKLYSTFCHFYIDSDRHEKILRHFDRKLDFTPFIFDSWVGDGFGKDSLNCYRIVSHKGRKFFEKIYKNKSGDLCKILRLHHPKNSMIDQLNIHTPRIHKILKGDVLTAVYFEYLDGLRHSSREQALFHYHKFFLKAYKLTTKNSDDSKDFQSHELYKDGRKGALEILKSTDEERFFELEAQVLRSRVIWSHGDWYHKNITPEGVIIDWDRCGYYPVGFDLGYCFSKSVTAEGLQSGALLGSRHIPKVVHESYLANFLFFCFVFYSRRVGRLLSDHDLKYLFDLADNYAEL
jgi:hypothetical protein